jgi:hypothetical protein
MLFSLMMTVIRGGHVTLVVVDWDVSGSDDSPDELARLLHCKDNVVPTTGDRVHLLNLSQLSCKRLSIRASPMYNIAVKIGTSPCNTI